MGHNWRSWGSWKSSFTAFSKGYDVQGRFLKIVEGHRSKPLWRRVKTYIDLGNYRPVSQSCHLLEEHTLVSLKYLPNDSSVPCMSQSNRLRALAGTLPSNLNMSSHRGTPGAISSVLTSGKDYIPRPAVQQPSLCSPWYCEPFLAQRHTAITTECLSGPPCLFCRATKGLLAESLHAWSHS